MTPRPKTVRALYELRRWLPTWWPVGARFCKRVLFTEGKGKPESVIGLAYPVYHANGRIKRFQIDLSLLFPDYVLRETAAHEWSHIMAWQPDASAVEEQAHNDLWSVAYGRCFRTVFEGSQGA